MERQSLQLNQKTGLRLSQQHLRYVEMLEYNTPELEEAVQRELEENPALEIAERSEEEKYLPEAQHNDAGTKYVRYYNPSNPDPEEYELTPRAHAESLYDALKHQISELTIPADVEATAEYLVDMLDSNGYLRRPLPKILDDLYFNDGIEIAPDLARRALDVIRSLEPAGVGASDLRDSLLLQLHRLPQSQERDDAMRILEEGFDAFTKKHKHRLVSELQLTPERVNAAIQTILSLNPKPGSEYTTETDNENMIIPDFIVNESDELGQLTLSLNSNIPDLQIEESFSEAMTRLKPRPGRNGRKGSEYIVSRYNDARDFIKILRRRQETMLTVMSAILKIQKDYFETRDISTLKPMMLKDIAALTGYDFSTISRATNHKFVATPWGVFPLKFFFSDTITDEGDTLTNRQIEHRIKEMVEHENKEKPLSDEKICQTLIEQGYNVSRRTVAKYRDRLGIPVARLRREL